MARLAILQNTQSATAARIATAVLLAPLVTYVVCSVSFPWLVARLYGVDLAKVGSRKLGGSNLAKSVGLAQGVAGGVLDGAKAFAAVLVARAFGLPLETQLACGVAASVAQMWPLFHRFDGGRANATGWGFAIAVDPVAALIMAIPILAAWVLTVLVRPRPTRLFPLASLLSFFVFPAVIWEQLGFTPAVAASLLLALLIVLRRVTAGLRDDLATGASVTRVVINRALYDRSELQERGLVPI